MIILDKRRPKAPVFICKIHRGGCVQPPLWKKANYHSSSKTSGNSSNCLSTSSIECPSDRICWSYKSRKETSSAGRTGIDQILFSFGGIPEKNSSVLSKPEVKENERYIPYIEMPGGSKRPEDFSSTLHLGAFSNFKDINKLASQFVGKNLENSVIDLMGNGWTIAGGKWGSKAVFEKIVDNVRYYAMWEPANMDHSTDNKPTSYWKITRDKIRQGDNDKVKRVSQSSNLQIEQDKL